MRRSVLLHLAWPLVGLGTLLSVACMASIWYINRLEAELGKSLRADTAELRAAQEAQIRLCQLQFHSVIHAAEPTPARREQTADDHRRFQEALAALRQQATRPDDLDDIAKLERGYNRYLADVGPGSAVAPPVRSPAELVAWADAHPVRELMATCQALTERADERMADTLARSEAQSWWAGRTLFAAGLFGPLAGLAAGYAVARGWSRRVAELSVRVRAVQAQLDQEVGEMTLEASGYLGDVDRQLEQVVGRVKEVCERLQTQEREILRTEQLAAVGHLAAGVAHEVRNPLTGIKMLVEAALRRSNPTPLTREDLELIRDEIARLERTAQGLLDFAKPSRPNRQPRDVRELVSHAVELARPRAERQAVRVAVALPEEELVAPVDADQFTSLLSNLLINALDATPPGGDVAVRVACQNGAAQISVADTGTGIDPSLTDRLFTPFATTKATGTGLGLTVASRVARDHGGALTAANRPGGGACFTVTLPVGGGCDAEVARRG